jgi:hypothetical protein
MRRGHGQIDGKQSNRPGGSLGMDKRASALGEPLTSDLHGGPRQAAACRWQAAARPRESSSAICVALPQRDRSSLLAKALPCDRPSSARLRPSTGPVVLSNALPRACRTTSPRQSTTRHQGPAVDFIRTSFYTFPGVARWPTFLHGCRSEVFDEILKEASIVLAEREGRGASKSHLVEAKRPWPKRQQTKQQARRFSRHSQESLNSSASR